MGGNSWESTHPLQPLCVCVCVCSKGCVCVFAEENGIGLVFGFCVADRVQAGGQRMRESGVTFCCSWVEAHWIAPAELQTPPRLTQGDRSMCVYPPPLSTICYPTTEPPRMGPEEGQLGVLQGSKDLK